MIRYACRAMSILSAYALSGAAQAAPPNPTGASFVQPGLLEMTATDTLPDGAMLFYDPAAHANSEVRVMSGEEIGVAKDDVVVIESFPAKASIAGNGFAIDTNVWIVIGTLDHPGEQLDEVDVRIVLQDGGKGDPVVEQQREKICRLARSVCEAIADLLYSKESRECERKYAGEDDTTRRIREQCIQFAENRFNDRRFNCERIYARCMGDRDATQVDIEPPFNPNEPRHRCIREYEVCMEVADLQLARIVDACDREFGPLVPNNPCVRGRLRCSDWFDQWSKYLSEQCNIEYWRCLGVAPADLPNGPPRPPANPPRRRMGDCQGDNLAGIERVSPGGLVGLRAMLEKSNTGEIQTNTLMK